MNGSPSQTPKLKLCTFVASYTPAAPRESPLGATSCLCEKVDIVEIALTLSALLTLPKTIQLTVEARTRSDELPPGLHSGAKGVENGDGRGPVDAGVAVGTSLGQRESRREE